MRARSDHLARYLQESSGKMTAAVRVRLAMVCDGRYV
jgi:hypothetical protein